MIADRIVKCDDQFEFPEPISAHENRSGKLPPHAPETDHLGLLRLRSDPVREAPPQLEAAFRS